MNQALLRLPIKMTVHRIDILSLIMFKLIVFFNDIGGRRSDGSPQLEEDLEEM